MEGKGSDGSMLYIDFYKKLFVMCMDEKVYTQQKLHRTSNINVVFQFGELGNVTNVQKIDL